MSVRPELRQRHGERGVALVVVLWILVVVTVLTMGFATATRTESMIAANLMDGVRAKALLQAGVERAVWSLRAPQGMPRWRSDGTPYKLDLGGSRVTIAILDEAGRVDLNAASPELLLRLLTRLGLGRGEVSRVHQLILARREAKGAAEPGAQPGSGEGPLDRAGPFQSPLELLQLPLPDGVAIGRLLPYVTVFAPEGKIAPQAADAMVLSSLEGVTQGQVEAVLAARSRPAPADPERLGALLAGARESLKAEVGPVYRVIVEATTRRGSIARLETVVWIDAAADDVPYRVLAWQENWPLDPLAEGQRR